MTAPSQADFSAAKVLPVIEIDDAAQAEGLADALARGGLTILELTLRSAAALPSLKRMKSTHPDLIIGMGTVLTIADAKSSIDAGADFLVTPGATETLLAGVTDLGVMALPGVATISEAMRAMEHGFSFLKFFPAEASGGVSTLKAFAGPLPAARFCPTGGVSIEKIPAYRALPNVVCVGGSWVAPRPSITGSDWGSITENARIVAQEI